MTKKLHAREMKQDRFREETGRALTRAAPFFQRHRSALIGAGIALVLSVVVWSVADAWRDRRQAASQDLLARALEAYEEATASTPDAAGAGDPAASLAKAQAALDELTDSYAGTEAGHVGQYYRGVVALRQGRPPEAVASLSSFLDDNPGHDLAPQALLALATAQEDAGDPGAAESALRRLADGDWELFPADAALMGLARFYERQGRRDEARALYERLTSEEAFTSSPYSRLAQQRLDS